MYPISNNLKNILETTTSLNSRSKIVVDNQEYISELKSYPTISHKNSKMIGGFPAKTCSFEIYDESASLNFEGKEITVYRGALINGNIEWIPQGIFIPQAKDITTNVSTKTISLNNAQDKTQLFDVPYKTNLTWLDGSTHTGLEIIQDICNTLGITLETTTFNWYNYNFKQPNFPTNITYREVISRLAEIGGSIAYISRTGGLAIRSQSVTNHSISRSRYGKLSKEKQFGVINVVVLGKDGIDDDVVYPNILPNTVVEWKILDNPFVDLYREEMIETVASYIIGQSIIPFKLTDFVDGFYLDLNDTVQVTDKNGNAFNAVILNYESTSRIKSSVGADVQTETQTNYKIAGSTKENIRNVISQVNHITGEITNIVNEIGDRSEKQTTITQDIDTIAQQVSSAVDLTKEKTQIGYIEISDAIESDLIKFFIVGEMSLLFPSEKIFPGSNIFPLDSFLIIEHDDGTKDKIHLPLNYLHYLNASTYDEFVVEDGQAKIIRRVGENSDGTLYELSNAIEEDKGSISILIKTGYNKIYLESFADKTLQYYLKYGTKNDLTDIFATNVEMNSEISQKANEINIETNKKIETATGTDELIAKINLKPGQVKLEGTVTANGNFKIFLDGSIEANNGTFSGNIYLDNGNKVIGGDGLITNLYFQSDGQYENFSWLGFKVNSSSNNFSYADVSLDFSIPNNFTIESAYLTLYHTPAFWSTYNESTFETYDVWGYSRNLRLYKITNPSANYQFNMTYGGEYETSISSSAVSEIPNAFGELNYNPSNTSGSNVEMRTTVNIKDSISIGRNKLIVRTSNSIPSSEAEACPQTGMARAVLSVIGYLKFEEGDGENEL